MPVSLYQTYASSRIAQQINLLNILHDGNNSEIKEKLFYQFFRIASNSLCFSSHLSTLHTHNIGLCGEKKAHTQNGQIRKKGERSS